jgi:UDP-N-acetylmuramate--alanine ligase
MHIFFSAIGGTGIGPLALIAKQAGYTVSGSDKQDSVYIQYLKSQGLTNIHIGQSKEAIQKIHEKNPIDWYVYSSAVTMEHAEPEELAFVKSQNIHHSKRDGLLNQILEDKNLKLIALAGTHGKSTTTAMVIWLFKQLGIPLSYSVGAKLSFGDMGTYDAQSEYFAYECDEFDRNFLAFNPYIAAITGVSWDHHEIFPTREDYQEAFREFISQSDHTICWQEDYDYLNLQSARNMTVLETDHPHIQTIKLAGLYNRLDAWIAIHAVHEATKVPIKKLVAHASAFPGLQRRMEKLVPNLYTDYAHTPEKITGCMSVALEMAEAHKQNVVVIYEPLTNRRQHFMRKDYKNCFNGASKVYWVPSYLAREDPLQEILSPEELIKDIDDPSIAIPMKRDTTLQKAIEKHLDAGDLVVAMSGGGGGSLDDWLRHTFVH